MSCIVYLADGTYLADGSIIARGSICSVSGIRLFYDTSEQELYIAKSDKTYLLTQFGMGSLSAILKSGLRTRDGLLLHSEAAIAQTDIELCSDVINFNSIGLKSIEFALIDAYCSDTIQVAVESRKTRTAAFASTAWKSINAEGAVRLSTIGLDFKVKVKVPSYTGIKLSNLKLAVQFRDKRYTRGLQTSMQGEA